MRIKIPFTNYDLNISKRGAVWIKNGQVVSFSDFTEGITFSTSTPLLEQIYSTVASEYAKLDYKHVIIKDGIYQNTKSSLNYLISERPNALQTKFDFFYTMMYQLYKYGNAIAFIQRDRTGKVIALEPINVCDYELGNGYAFENGVVLIKYRERKTNSVVLADYRNIIHLRYNPNDVFYGDTFTGASNGQVLIDVVDKALNSLLTELSESGTVRGVIKIGQAGIGYSNGFANRTLLNQKDKIGKQEEIVERIKSNKHKGILVLDAGEDWQSLSSPFSTVTSEQIDKYIDLLLRFYSMNKKVISGEANADEMEVFFNRIIAPRVDQTLAEMNYKIFTPTARTQGHRIEYYRNAFEYLPLDKAIDVAYKSIQDTTTNERRAMIYHLPPVEGGDEIYRNKNFAPLPELMEYYEQQSQKEGDTDGENS